MADTIQVVLWALGQKCPLRQGADWENPATAIETLSDCCTYSRLRKREGRRFGVFGDVCVTSVTSALSGDGNSRYDYPSSGFVLSSQFSSVGGLPSLASRRHQRFVEQVIYHGLKNLSPRDGDEPEWLFSPEDTEEIFHRCEVHGGKVLYLSHLSESGEHDEYAQVSWPTSAEKALQMLREKGCNEKFSVTVKIPKEIVDRWDEPQSG